MLKWFTKLFVLLVISSSVNGTDLCARIALRLLAAGLVTARSKKSSNRGKVEFTNAKISRNTVLKSSDTLLGGERPSAEFSLLAENVWMTDWRKLKYEVQVCFN